MFDDDGFLYYIFVEAPFIGYFLIPVFLTPAIVAIIKDLYV